MAENFDLIFGQNASQQYAWNDADYQNGWETIGNNPPTAAQFDALQRRSDTKMKELNDELTPLVNADTADSRQPSTTYSEGDIKYSPLLPTGWFLTCTTAGITSANEIVLPTPIAEGDTVTDGEVVWTIRKISSGADIPIATEETNGLMSAADKTKLNGIATGANNYSLPAATSSTRGGVTIGANISLSGDKISLTKGNVTNALGYTPPTHDYSLPAATSSTRGGVKIGSNISLSGDTISLAKANVTNALGYTPPTTNTTYSTGTASYSGITKLYTGTGDNTDGTMTQKAIKAIVGTGGGIVAASLTTNGYVKFANGFIVQWGTASTTNNWNTPITLPISFSNTGYSIVLTATNQQGSPTDGPYIDPAGVKCKNTNKFYGGLRGSDNTFSWIAVGY